MASESANTASDDEVNLLPDGGKAERSDLVDGRVWRRVNSVVSSDSSGGPVLRTTVKPVKRFRPESSSDKTSNPSPNRKKKVKVLTCSSGKSDETCGSAEGKKSFAGDSGSLILPVKPRSSTPDTEKLASGSQISGEGNPPMKKKRVREQWSMEDKDFFFEAVAVYGKDFEAIRSSIAHKHRKKGQDSMAKTKNQVRHFYYRTWAMINKMIDSDSYPLEINKAFQELYALINYGELRRKLGGNLKKRGLDKLNELIRHGTTSLRFRGKNFRIKTPSCRALKKLSPENQGKEGILDFPLVSDTRRMKIPLHVNIDLYPLTMADWNRVHSYAHNPRLRLKVSTDTPLSTLLNYLDRKWKPLSERLLSFATKTNWHEARNQTGSCGMPSCLVLQTPSDASVNTRIMVFQVSGNKAHAVVSYALRKATKTVEKSHRDVDNKNDDNAKESSVPVDDTGGGAVSETEALDSCLSSEEDYDYDSANEEATGTSKCDQYGGLADSACKDSCTNMPDEFSPQTLNTHFTLKSKDSFAQNGSDSPNDSIGVDEKTIGDGEAGLKQFQSTVTTIDDSEFDCSAEPPDVNAPSEDNRELTEELLKAADSMLGNESDAEDEIVQRRENTLDTPTLELSLVEAEENVADGCSDDRDGNPCLRSEDTQPNVVLNIGGELESQKNEDDELDVINNDKFATSRYRVESKTRKKCRSIKNSDFIKAVQTWKMESCTNTTVAEVYMMLGKPSMFKLCYHWLHKTEKIDMNGERESCDDGKSQSVASLSSGLSVLLQEAGISKHLRDSDATHTREQKSASLSLKSTKTVSVQCEIIKEAAKVPDGVILPVGSSASGNPHGRGLSKMVCATLPTPVAVVQPTSEFVVPTQRVVGRRKPNYNPKNRLKISPQTLNDLLQRERLRSRLVRRPIVMDRSAQSRPLRTTTRPMRTFSIVTQGPQKVGFMPSTTVAVTLTEPTSKTSRSHVDGQPMSATGATSSANNLLAQAAQEAGVFPGLDSSSSSACSINNFTTLNESIQKRFVIPGFENAHVSNAHGSTMEHVTENPVSLPLSTDTANMQNEVELMTSHLLQNKEDTGMLPVASSSSMSTATQFCNVSDHTGAMRPGSSQTEISELNAREAVENAFQIPRDNKELPEQVNETEEYFLITPQDILPDDNVEDGIADFSGTTIFNATAPQMILPSDSEDSFDGILIRQRHQSAGLHRLSHHPSFGSREDSMIANERGIPSRNTASMQVSPSSLPDDFVPTSTDIALDLQLPSLIGENSIDLMSKFQDLVRHTADDIGLTSLANDDNARDRPIGEIPFDFSSSSGFENA